MGYSNPKIVTNLRQCNKFCPDNIFVLSRKLSQTPSSKIKIYIHCHLNGLFLKLSLGHVIFEQCMEMTLTVAGGGFARQHRSWSQMKRKIFIILKYLHTVILCILLLKLAPVRLIFASLRAHKL